MLRYEGFGKELYEKMSIELPFSIGNIKLFKNIETQTLDSYAVFDNGNSKFAIQLDPESEVIILWNHDKQIEFGGWTANLYDSICREIKTYMYKP